MPKKVTFERSLASLYPDAAALWHPTLNGKITPSSVLPGVSTKAWWLGDCKHAWETAISTVARGGRCPYCKGRQVLAGFNDLATKNPALAAQWHPSKNADVSPTEVMPGSNRDTWWLGECGHEWEAKISGRAKGKGCPYCAGRKVLIGFNDLATKRPDVAAQWVRPFNESDAGITPQDVTAGTEMRVLWRCTKGHEWDVAVNTRTSKSRAHTGGCPECKHAPSEGQDVASLYPHIVAQWHPTKNDFSLSEVSPGTSKAGWWVCDYGHEWFTDIALRAQSNPSQCSECPRIREASIADDDRKLAFWDAEKNAPIEPLQVALHSNTKYWWKCEEGHSWLAPPGGKVKCATCAGRTVLVGFNDLATKNPELAAQWHPTKNGNLTPQMIPSRTKDMVWWMCEKGHEWRAMVDNRNALGGRATACPSCWSACRVSRAEKEVAEVISLLLGENVAVHTSNRSAVHRVELDVYIPDMKLAIEFNGLYWHSELRGKDSTYHTQKTRKCAEAGIQLIHVWEDDWRDRRDIVIRALAHRLGATGQLDTPGVLSLPDPTLSLRYGARTLSRELLTHEESAEFLRANHIQGAASGTLHVGLRDKNSMLRAVLVVKRVGNKNHVGEWRIERYATRGIIPGGFTRALKYAEETIADQGGNLTKWVTFSDSALSDGGLYASTGFVAEESIPADYMYVVNGNREHKFGYRLKRFRDDDDLLYEDGLTERELAQLNEIPRIWDTGKTRWVKSVA